MEERTRADQDQKELAQGADVSYTPIPVKWPIKRDPVSFGLLCRFILWIVFSRETREQWRQVWSKGA